MNGLNNFLDVFHALKGVAKLKQKIIFYRFDKIRIDGLILDVFPQYLQIVAVVESVHWKMQGRDRGLKRTR